MRAQYCGCYLRGQLSQDFPGNAFGEVNAHVSGARHCPPSGPSGANAVAAAFPSSPKEL